MRSRRLS